MLHKIILGKAHIIILIIINLINYNTIIESRNNMRFLSRLIQLLHWNYKVLILSLYVYPLTVLLWFAVLNNRLIALCNGKWNDLVVLACGRCFTSPMDATLSRAMNKRIGRNGHDATKIIISDKLNSRFHSVTGKIDHKLHAYTPTALRLLYSAWIIGHETLHKNEQYY